MSTEKEGISEEKGLQVAGCMLQVKGVSIFE